MSIKDFIIRRLVYIKRMYIHGVEHLELGTHVDLALAILNFDNAIEMLLYAILEFFRTEGIKEKRFHDLLRSVRETVQAKKPNIKIEEILHEREILNQHLARNNVQHHGIIPNLEDLKRYQSLTETVLIEAVSNIFELDFSQISLGIMIKDDLVREMYITAENSIFAGDYEKSLIYCVAAFETAKNKEQFRIYGSGISVVKAMVSSLKVDSSLKVIIGYMNKLNEELEILKLRLDYKKYQKYREICPKLEPFLVVTDSTEEINPIIHKVSMLLKDVKKDVSFLKEYLVFSLNFVIESILRWESVERRGIFEPLSRFLSWLKK